MILSCYEGGRFKVIHMMQRSIEELTNTGEDPEILEMLEDLVLKLENCSNQEFFQVKGEILFDNEEDEVEEA